MQLQGADRDAHHADGDAAHRRLLLAAGGAHRARPLGLRARPRALPAARARSAATSTSSAARWAARSRTTTRRSGRWSATCWSRRARWPSSRSPTPTWRRRAGRRRHPPAGRTRAARAPGRADRTSRRCAPSPTRPRRRRCAFLHTGGALTSACRGRSYPGVSERRPGGRSSYRGARWHDHRRQRGVADREMRRPGRRPSRRTHLRGRRPATTRAGRPSSARLAGAARAVPRPALISRARREGRHRAGRRRPLSAAPRRSSALAARPAPRRRAPVSAPGRPSPCSAGRPRGPGRRAVPVAGDGARAAAAARRRLRPRRIARLGGQDRGARVALDVGTTPRAVRPRCCSSATALAVVVAARARRPSTSPAADATGSPARPRPRSSTASTTPRGELVLRRVGNDFEVISNGDVPDGHPRRPVRAAAGRSAALSARRSPRPPGRRARRRLLAASRRSADRRARPASIVVEIEPVLVGWHDDAPAPTCTGGALARPAGPGGRRRHRRRTWPHSPGGYDVGLPRRRQRPRLDGHRAPTPRCTAPPGWRPCVAALRARRRAAGVERAAVADVRAAVARPTSTT